MPGLDSRRIALVVAQSRTGPAGQAAEEVATGYFLTGNLVLTVRHVAQTPDATFAVRSELGGEEAEHWSHAVPVWRGVGDVDALLLQTAKAFGDWQPPPFVVDRETGQWRSSGYARGAAETEENLRKTFPLLGSFGPRGGQGNVDFALTTAQHVTPTEEYNWKGLSGAPVMSDGLAEDGLLGIITNASRAWSNSLIALPVSRLLSDIHFRALITPSDFPQLPAAPYCLVITAENATLDLVGKVQNVLAGFRQKDPSFADLHETPVEIPVVKAFSSVENWVVTIEALARARFLIADVTAFEPAVMVILGVRSVLRRGVTVSVTADSLDRPSMSVPFNVQETKVISYRNVHFYDNLYRAMSEGYAAVAADPNYLDLPAFRAVRAPRPESWANDDPRTILVLCPFNADYSAFYEADLQPAVRGQTGDLTPLRMLDLRSPRLVGQALYEQIRWASRCLVDWTGWRPNVFFELGVRLACSDRDPFCIVSQEDLVEADASVGTSGQRKLLCELLNPVAYDPRTPAAALGPGLQLWARNPQAHLPPNFSIRSLPPAGTFAVAQSSYVWKGDTLLTPPHIEHREGAERALGRDQERHPERLILFADNEQFDVELRAAVREKWIAAWLYLRHLQGEEESVSDDLLDEFRRVSQLVEHALGSSREPRHRALRDEIREILRAERARRKAARGGVGDG